MTRGGSHIVLIPAFNPGGLLARTVAEALEQWDDVWVVVDGSTDGSHERLGAGGPPRPGLRVIVRERRGGKGAAVLTGAAQAMAEGRTHALVMDADCQHPAGRIEAFMRESMASPQALVCGRPVFGPDAPWIRLAGRRISAWLVRAETLGRGAEDPLFGFRVYPLAALAAALAPTRGARGYDFDPEAAVRLAWRGVPAVNLDAPCVYVSKETGGVSHFRYFGDNVHMATMHIRLILSLLTGRMGARPS
jgi:glycosyltransferase involved in cell wall biosynthesis